jgi:hypothetical protein
MISDLSPYYVRYMKTPAAAEVTSKFAGRIAQLTDSVALSLPRDRVAEVGQFFATLLVLQGEDGISTDIKKAITKRFKSWSRKWQGTFAEETSDRCLITMAKSRYAFASRESCCAA